MYVLEMQKTARGPYVACRLR